MSNLRYFPDILLVNQNLLPPSNYYNIDLSNKNRLQISTDPYTYRVDTDVITSIELYSDIDITPANPISVTFNMRDFYKQLF